MGTCVSYVNDTFIRVLRNLDLSMICYKLSPAVRCLPLYVVQGGPS